MQPTWFMIQRSTNQGLSWDNWYGAATKELLAVPLQNYKAARDNGYSGPNQLFRVVQITVLETEQVQP